MHDQQDVHAVAAYYADESAADGQDGAGPKVVFDTRLGLAVEGMAEGMTTQQLWSVL